MSKEELFIRKKLSEIVALKKKKGFWIWLRRRKTGKRLLDLGFEIEACDMDAKDWI